MYKCSKCNAPVIVLPFQAPITICKCNAPIIGDASSKLTSNGGIK